MKKIPENFPCALSLRAVPLGFNLPSNRYPFPVACRSDCTNIQVWFYEYHGMYWYSVAVGSRSTFNSVPFLSLANCCSEFRAFLRAYGFVMEDRELAEKRLRGFRRSVTPPKSCKV